MENPEHLVTKRELARELRLPTAWLKAEADADRIPFLLVGRDRRFNVEAVRRALLRRAADPDMEGCRPA
jgi:hypothetical protein